MLAIWLSGAASAATLDAQVEEMARRALLDQAQQAGLLAPEVQLTLPAPKPRPACAGGWDIVVQDLRSLLRLRLVARCDDGRTPAQDYLLRATLSADVLVLAQPVGAGAPLGDEDVQLLRRDVSQIPDAVSTLEPGMAARSSLRAGQVLQKRLLVAALVVKRGDQVRILANRRGISVEASGEALDSGARQGVIRVRNASTGRVIQARVLDAGLVEPAELSPAAPAH